MRNTYLTGYLPLISIILFSSSFTVYLENQLLIFLRKIGLYEGLLEFFSGTEIKLAILFIIFLLFFMLFSAIKLISDTILQFGLLLFARETNGESLKSVRFTSIIYCIGGMLSVFLSFSIYAVGLLFFITTMVAFTYIVYKVSFNMSAGGLVGFVFFQTLSVGAILATISYTIIKIYNTLLASLQFRILNKRTVSTGIHAS